MEEEIENDSILPRSCDKFENVEEEVENVEVDGDGREDVLLRGDRELVVAPHHHLVEEIFKISKLKNNQNLKSLAAFFYLSVVDQVD